MTRSHGPRCRCKPVSLRDHLARAAALLAGYAIAAVLVLWLVVAALGGFDAPRAGDPIATPPSGDTWGLPIVEPTRTTAPRPSWLVTLPSGAPAGLDLEDLCAQLQAPGEVPECADLGY